MPGFSRGCSPSLAFDNHSAVRSFILSAFVRSSPSNGSRSSAPSAGAPRFGRDRAYSSRFRGMKVSLALLTLVAAGSTVIASPLQKLGDFELTDQNAMTRSYRFPKAKITAMTVADHKGSDQLAPWIQKLYDRYERRIDIDGVADVSMIPKPFHGMICKVFRKRVTHSVMLDWGGAVVKRFGYAKGVANIYVIDRRGWILKQVTGPVSDDTEEELFREIDRALTVASSNDR